MGRAYALISPCRNEAEYMRKTLDSVTRQTVPPSLWVVVDDGSTDQSPRILAEYAAKFDFIRVVQRKDRGKRSVGPGVIEAFYEGYSTVDPQQYQYVCKLDMDLDLPLRYFQTLMEQMEQDPRIGTCSGKPYVRGADGQMTPEPCGNEISVGMTKFYRVECFQDIGGFVCEVMWDCIDCHHCRMRGWIACASDGNPDLRFVHLRPEGSSDKGILTGRMRHGYGQYFMGTGLGYMTISAVYRAMVPPLIIGGLAMWWGYVRSALTGAKRYPDAGFRTFLRQFQRRCLIYGKKRATKMTNDEQTRVWAARHKPVPV
jgi:poly-beta-1,6-N-acetyl-D-glucosamine synthase